MKVSVELIHRVMASPREVIENYMDYGHEVYLHGKYSKGKKKHVSKITKVKYRVISALEREVEVPVVIMGIRTTSVQHVSFVPWSAIASSGPFLGFPAQSIWHIEQKDPGGETLCRVLYRFDIPWYLWFLAPLFHLFIPHLRRRVWEEDKTMLERRDFLMKRGYGDGGIRPKERI